MSLRTSFEPVSDSSGRIAYPDVNAVSKLSLLPGSVTKDGDMLRNANGAYYDPKTTYVRSQLRPQ